MSDGKEKETAMEREREDVLWQRRIEKRRERRKEVLYLRLTVLIFLAVLLILMGVEKVMKEKELHIETVLQDQTEETADTTQATEKVTAEADTQGTELHTAGTDRTGSPENSGDKDAQSQETFAAGGVGDEGITHIRSCSDQWNLILVNPWNAIPADYQVELKDLSGGQAVDARCYPMLQQMMDDCRSAGLDPVICSSWRSRKKQEDLIANKEQRLILAGCPSDQAAAEAAKTVAVPGTSEHELGLALDIVDSSYRELETEQENTPVQKWLMENSWKYGFVLRYPSDKSDLTGIIYEPWHYRYVGKEAAEVMYREHLCLEEYLERYL